MPRFLIRKSPDLPAFELDHYELLKWEYGEAYHIEDDQMAYVPYERVIRWNGYRKAKQIRDKPKGRGR